MATILMLFAIVFALIGIAKEVRGVRDEIRKYKEEK